MYQLVKDKEEREHLRITPTFSTWAPTKMLLSFTSKGKRAAGSRFDGEVIIMLLGNVNLRYRESPGSSTYRVRA